MGLDNGGHLGNSQNNYPLRGGKTTEFEGGLRQSAFVSGGFLPPQMRGKTTHALMHICVSNEQRNVHPHCRRTNLVAEFTNLIKICYRMHRRIGTRLSAASQAWTPMMLLTLPHPTARVWVCQPAMA